MRSFVMRKSVATSKDNNMNNQVSVERTAKIINRNCEKGLRDLECVKKWCVDTAKDLHKTLFEQWPRVFKSKGGSFWIMDDENTGEYYTVNGRHKHRASLSYTYLLDDQTVTEVTGPERDEYLKMEEKDDRPPRIIPVDMKPADKPREWPVYTNCFGDITEWSDNLHYRNVNKGWTFDVKFSGNLTAYLLNKNVSEIPLAVARSIVGPKEWRITQDDVDYEYKKVWAVPTEENCDGFINSQGNFVSLKPFANMEIDNGNRYLFSKVEEKVETLGFDRKIAEIVRIHDLYEGAPCHNGRHDDNTGIAFAEHGEEAVILTLGDCRKHCGEKGGGG